MACAATVDEDGGLCPACWRDAEFISGASCSQCGAPCPMAEARMTRTPLSPATTALPARGHGSGQGRLWSIAARGANWR
ncbi:double zinc ribbon domain-containing protein [Paracoccus cavernae]|uniref:double zinc ribbon domain-containing protein n=1 Tax=Paracoccus cavernae TaxID=1571207 RepID=UPI0036412A19